MLSRDWYSTVHTFRYSRTGVTTAKRVCEVNNYQHCIVRRHCTARHTHQAQEQGSDADLSWTLALQLHQATDQLLVDADDVEDVGEERGDGERLQ